MKRTCFLSLVNCNIRFLWTFFVLVFLNFDFFCSFWNSEVSRLDIKSCLIRFWTITDLLSNSSAFPIVLLLWILQFMLYFILWSGLNNFQIKNILRYFLKLRIHLTGNFSTYFAVWPWILKVNFSYEARLKNRKRCRLSYINNFEALHLSCSNKEDIRPYEWERKTDFLCAFCRQKRWATELCSIWYHKCAEMYRFLWQNGVTILKYT